MSINLDNYKPSKYQLDQLNLLTQILSECESKSIKVLVTGGYCYDALYGKLTRDHHDLDIYIHQKDIDPFIKLVSKYGFKPNNRLIGAFKQKSMLVNESFVEELFIEYGIIEEGEKSLNLEQKEKFFTKEPIGVLNNIKIWTPSLYGLKLMIKVNQNIYGAKSYRHLDWENAILEKLEEKYKE